MAPGLTSLDGRDVGAIAQLSERLLGGDGLDVEGATRQIAAVLGCDLVAVEMLDRGIHVDEPLDAGLVADYPEWMRWLEGHLRAEADRRMRSCGAAAGALDQK